MPIVVCMKWVPRRIVVDPSSATFEIDPRTFGPSPADAAALEVALVMAEHDDDSVTVVCAGPEAADAMLRDALAMGAHRAVRCPAGALARSADVAEALGVVCAEADLVLCGDYSTDRGSGSVPAFIAAHLDAAQALGVVGLSQTIDPADDLNPGVPTIVAERRLDRGRRARLRVALPAVVSIEGAVTLDGETVRPRRASLSGIVAAKDRPIEVGPTVRERPTLTTSALRAHRPRTRVRPAPSDAPPAVRILDITKATESRNPPKTLHLGPEPAADATIEALRDWGYVE